ncbi:unnamed protein product [Cuscuta epithymum]|uniref:Uncharacterized protein n=1 Tax=Cuscuta epithymum TaxID=186058 RepID=A0AAV0GCG8_9ASTE|nr:unnamed protein product [Cuscuta epithymum]
MPNFPPAQFHHQSAYQPSQNAQSPGFHNWPASHTNQPSAAWASVNNSILGPVPQPQAWFPDSGATHHVTADPHNLQHSELPANSDKLFMGNGQGF